jgi:hypothetical protein
MALQGAIQIDFGTVFPDGAYAAGGFEPVRDFDRSQGDRFVQQLDKGTGLPLWVAEVIDADPKARDRTVKVKVAAEHQPTLPPAPAGVPFTAVEFTGMTVTPYVDSSRCQGGDRCRGRQAYSLKATGVRAPSRGTSVRPSGENKDAA